MNSSSDAAETIVRMSLQGTEIALRVTGTAAKNIGAILMAVSKDKTKTKGKTTLNNMLKSGSQLKVFSLKKEDLKKFVKEAKKYGVLYHVLVNRKQTRKDGLVDLLVRAEDAPKINRIFERFGFKPFERASINNDESKLKSKSDMDVKKENISKNINEKEESLNPNMESEKSPLSDISSSCSKEGSSKADEKPSIRKLLKRYKEIIDKKVLPKDRTISKGTKKIYKKTRDKKRVK